MLLQIEIGRIWPGNRTQLRGIDYANRFSGVAYKCLAGPKQLIARIDSRESPVSPSSPGKQGGVVSETLPQCFATVIVLCYHGSELL